MTARAESHHPARPAAPQWSSERLRPVGIAAWSLVGVAVLVIAVMLMLLVLRFIVLALAVALFLAIVFAPVVDALARRGLGRAAGAAAATLIVIATAVGAMFLVVAGVLSQQQEIGQNLDAAVAHLQSLLTSAGMSPNAAESADQSVRGSAETVLMGLLPALGSLFGAVADVAIGIFVALFTCFFLLKDGRSIAARAASWMPLPGSQAKQLLDQAASTIRHYFVGLTVLGVFNAAVVVVGALILDVPLVGAIAVITLLGSYVPYVGAVVAGAFAVMIALGAGGTSTALWMLLTVFLANSVLQTLITPSTYGAALDVSPLLLLLTAILGAVLAGVVGLTLAAPVTAIVVHSMRLLRGPGRPADADGVRAGPLAPVATDGKPA